MLGADRFDLIAATSLTMSVQDVGRPAVDLSPKAPEGKARNWLATVLCMRVESGEQPRRKANAQSPAEAIRISLLTKLNL